MNELETYNNIGIGKTKNPPLKTLILAIMAGVFISLAGLASTIGSFGIDNISVSKIISGAIFPIGLILVILLKTELFTGNILLTIPLVQKKIKINKLLLNLILVYLGNLIGSIIIALLLHESGIVTEALKIAFTNITTKKVSYSFTNLLILGFLCNFLVCIAVFLGVTKENTIEKIFVIFIPIFLFIVLGFEHSIANMFYLTMGFLEGSFSLSNLILNNLLPVTLGNILGGIVISLIFVYTKSK